MITIVDYGLGNVQAIANIYKRLGIPVRTATNADELQDVQKAIIPGVGAFDWAMARLTASGMKDRLNELVLGQGVPVLGICVGMQIMANRSDEGQLPGLGWIDADVRRFDVSTFSNSKTRLPHMGWNDIAVKRSEGLFKGLEQDARFYFLHSYYFRPNREEDAMTVTHYNGDFVSGAGHGKVFGVQFHPEKSHNWGIQLLKNFAEL